MRELYFGGSFNPIHNGHLRTARAVAERAEFDRVVLVPAAVSPHKIDAADLVSTTDRLAMCQLAANSAAAGGWFRVDDLEFRRPPPSYTIQTVRELKNRGISKVYWLIGADQLTSLPRWREAEALIAEAEFVVMARPGFALDFSTLPVPFQSLEGAIIEVTQVDISSTDIRRRVGLGLPIDELVPHEVAEYIESHQLYRVEPK